MGIQRDAGFGIPIIRIMSNPTRGPRQGSKARRPRIMFVSPAQFRELRQFTGKTREDVADLLGVSVRTVGNWETGAARVPYAPFKLLRAIHRGDTLQPGWEAFRFVRGRLVTPEGHAFHRGDLAWLSLLVQRANFRSLTRVAARMQDQPAGRALALGLVTSATSQKSAVDTSTKCIHSATFSPDGPVVPGPVSPGSNTGQKAQGQQGEGDGSSPKRAHFGAVEAGGGPLRGIHRGQPKCAGGRCPSGLPRSEAVARRGGAGAGGRSPRRAARGAVYVGANTESHRSQSRRKPALPVRQPQAVQAVPRRTLTVSGGAS